LENSGFESLIADFAELKAKIADSSISTKELAQDQANLIDLQKSLAEIRTKEMAQSNNLQRKLKDLSDATHEFTAVSEAQHSEIISLDQELVDTNKTIASMAIAAKGLGSALGSVVGAIEGRERTTSGLIAKNAAAVGEAASKAAGPLGELAKVAGGALMKALPTAVTGVLSVVGTALSSTVGAVVGGVAALNMVLRAATREYATFGSAYGASLGFAMTQQTAFKTSVSAMGWATLDMAKVQQVGSAAMKAGAFDAYTANQRMARTNQTLSSAATDVARDLGRASEVMTKLGRAFGMTEDASGALLGVFTSMGAFNASLGDIPAKMDRVTGRFGAMNNITGLSMTKLFDMMSTFSETALPMGASFNTLTAQSTMAMKALGDYAAGIGESGDQFLTSSANMEKMTKAMYAYGASLSPTQTLGYNMSMGKGGGDPFKNILDTISKTGFERMGDQMKAFKGMGMGTDQTVVAMMQSGLPEKYATQMRNLLNDPAARRGMEVATSGASKDKIAAEMAKMDPKTRENIDDMSNKLAFMEDPLQQIARFTGQSVDLLGVIASKANDAGRKALGIRDSGYAEARKPVPLGRH
jgi:hypothetical protein